MAAMNVQEALDTLKSLGTEQNRKIYLRHGVAEDAARIGKVKVDHGETGCKTPDAVPYIKKAVERKK
jgi:hypothetical protein